MTGVSGEIHSGFQTIAESLSPPVEMLLAGLRDMGSQIGAIACFAEGFGIDRFELQIPLIIQSTNIPEQLLREAVSFSREVVRSKLDVVPNQHVVSKSILKRFATHDNSGIKLQEYGLHSGLNRYLTSVRNAATVQNFVKLDSRRMENHWGDLETHFPIALESVSSGRDVFDRRSVEIVKDIMALHFARSHELKTKFDLIHASNNLDILRQMPIDDNSLRQSFYERFGYFVTDTNVAREFLIEQLSRDYEQRAATGVYFRFRLPDFFNSARKRIQESCLQILRPAPGAGEFLIGDNPLVTADREQARFGMLEGVPIGDANLVVMPLARHVCVSLSQVNEDLEIGKADVDRLNSFQVRTAKESVYFHPSAELGTYLHELTKVDYSRRWRD